ncbi:MAG: histidine kinase [Oceanospirillaceae bacterium]|nr:histidine kinase [Oceanospirillaceae bacterium]MBT12576.1 histidine kinase [Oceanospirillaceae bacterium]|tara:strand:- start:19822 stop:20445 length:624 start_codon:yes stop_codon:yes gene_type:complete
MNTQTQPVVDLNEDQRDCYQELTNVAMGQAADRLARLLDAYVVLPIPKVNLIEANDLRMAIQEVEDESAMSAVCQGFIGSGIAGEALLLFNDTSFHDLSTLMNYPGELDRFAEMELLMDVSSLLIGACIQGIGEQLEIHFNQGHPVILGQHCKVEDLLKPGNHQWTKTLAIEIHYTLEHVNIDCDLLLLFTEDSVIKLNDKINYLLD